MSDDNMSGVVRVVLVTVKERLEKERNEEKD
jgi:hypothetical protein